MIAPITWSDSCHEHNFTNWLNTVCKKYELIANSLVIASADASFRRYFRIFDKNANSFIIMDAAGPDIDSLDNFINVQKLFTFQQLPVPEIMALDRAKGFVLMSDLGQQTLLQALAPDFNTSRAFTPFKTAVDWLVRWQLASQPNVLPPYSEAVLQKELDLFPQWYLGQHRKVTFTTNQKEILHTTFQNILKRCQSVPQVYVHRDFMPRNVMTHSSEPLRLSGILDFQDALYGPITYDISSLMRDAFCSWQEDFVIDISVRYWEKAKKAGLLAQAPQLEADFGAFYEALEWMGLQRHLKVAGIFARLSLRDKKPQYLADAPRFIQYIRNCACRYSELFPFLKLIDSIEGTQYQHTYAFGRS